ncbi:MAG: CHC2 zinc finger domain-containing protein, partial [Tannerellaceae bacterium]|nr:CHC2 zinc finger domain-containing protein [Tannerellaceae bacterium]
MDIQQLKASHCIGQVAGRYVQLTYRERKATGRCPFHDDHTPSLRIDLDRQSYICFACGAQGDVIHFIRQIEQCSFAEAVRYLTGGTQPPVQAGGGRQGGRAPAPSTKTRKPQLTPAMVAANEQFLSLLMPAVAGHPGLAATWLSFETGHAPHLLPAAWKQMAGRLIFPIRDHTGQLAGFAARRLTDTAGSKEAKYINSAASAGFHKSGILYGFYQAREAIAKTGCVFLTEGYKDTLAMHAAGFTHSVGLGGTAFTDEQLALLLPVAKLFYILCDADPAGREAAARIATRLAREPVACRIVHLPGGHDPDSLFRQLGPADFTRYI